MSIWELWGMIYDLRNQVTHTGSIRELDTQIVLVEMAKEPFAGRIYTGRTLYLSIYDFCDKMFYAAENVTIDERFWTRISNVANGRPQLEVLSNDKYVKIYSEIVGEWRKFWDAHQEGKELYQASYIWLLGKSSTIAKGLDSDDKLCICGLQRSESMQLIKIAKEVDKAGEDLDRHIAEKYFK